jgi:hypothetical protein
MKTKTIKKTALLTALLLTAGIVLSACGQGASERQTMYGAWKTVKAPTCTEVGVETRTSLTDAGVSQSRYIPALGHDYGEWEIVTAATTEAAGLQRQYCKHDNAHFVEEVIPKLSGMPGEEPDPEEPETIPEPPAIPADGAGVFVLGGYATFIEEARVYAVVKDFENYCNENGIERGFIGWRMYPESTVAELCTAVRLDNDVDALLGVGNNINSAGNLDGGYVTAKSDAVTIYFSGGANDATRRHARMNDQTLTLAYWEYILSDRAVAILTAVLPPKVRPATESPVVEDAPGVFLLGGYATFIKEEKIYLISKDFESYCNENAIARSSIGWRMYPESTVADLSAAVRTDNDVDALLGAGNNINSTGNLDGGYVKAKSDAVTIYFNGGANDATRRHVRMNDEALTMAFWEYILSQRAADILELNCEHRYVNGFCSICGALKPLESVRILLVGNSYTYYNDHMLANTLKALAADARYNVTVDEISYGSSRLQYYYDGQYSDEFKALLDANTYQYIVLQEHSTYPVSSKTNFVNSVTALNALLTEKQSSAEVVMYMTWARRIDNSWLADNNMTAKEMEDKLYDAYSAAATAIGARLAPVGRAFGLLRENPIEMYAEDATHPSPAGSYLAALMLYASIFGENPAAASYTPAGVALTEAALLRTTARAAVKAG